MKSTRITNDDRNTMVEHMVGKAIKKTQIELFQESTKLFHEVRDYKLGKHKKAFDSLPKSLVNVVSSVTIFCNVGETFCVTLKNVADTTDMRFMGGNHYPDTKEVSFPYFSGGRYSLKEGNSKLEKRLRDYYDATNELNKKKNILTQTLSSTLAKITTTRKLEENWPEGYEVYKSLFVSKVNTQLPALPTAKLNAMLEDFPDAVEV
jgi:hypothetical protein